MFDIEIIVNILALMSIILFNISNFRKTKKGILHVRICCNICDIVMYILVEGKTGTANAFADMCKNIAFTRYNSSIFVILFAGLRIILLCFGYEGILTVLFIISEIIATYAIIRGSTQQLRIITLIRQCIWVVYDYKNASAFVALLTFTGCVSAAAAIIKNKSNFK